MPGTFTIVRIFGIRIALHYTWLFIFFLVAWLLARNYFPMLHPGASSATSWTLGVAGSLGLFMSILIHELTHSVVALARGRKVKSITLFILGGVSEIEGEAKGPYEEFIVAIVGPLSSFVISFVAWVLMRTAGQMSWQLEAVLLHLAVVNLALGVFNLLPGFPLDGGRVLRSLVWRWTGSLHRSTRIASTVGQLMGVGLIAIGIIIAFTTTDFAGGLWLAFIGWFLRGAAGGSYQQLVLSEALAGRTVRDAMRTDVQTVVPWLTLDVLVEEHLLGRSQRALPVVDGSRVTGLISLTNLRGIAARDRPSRRVAQAMAPREQLAIVSPSDSLETALGLLMSRDVNQLVVLSGERLEGLVSRADILQLAETQRQLAGTG